MPGCAKHLAQASAAGTGAATRRSGLMDDKTLDLWRQIDAHRLSGGQASTTMRSYAKLEGCRRAKKLAGGRTKPGTPPASVTATDPA